MHAQLARARAEQVAFHAHDVAHVEPLIERVVRFRNRIFANVDLQALARLHQVHETGLAHAADGLNPAGDAHARLIGNFLRGLGAVVRRICGMVWLASNRWP